MIFKPGDSLTILAKFIPLSLPGTGLNNVGTSFCPKAENDRKNNTHRNIKFFFIMADTIMYSSVSWYQCSNVRLIVNLTNTKCNYLHNLPLLFFQFLFTVFIFSRNAFVISG